MAEDNNSNMKDEDYVYNKEEIDQVIAKFKSETKGEKSKKKKKEDYGYYKEGETATRRLSGKGFMIFFLCLLLLVGGGLCLYFFVFNKSDEGTGFDNISVNNGNLGTITTTISDGSNNVTAIAHEKGNAVFLGWAKGNIYNNVVVTESPSLTISLNDEANYIALFNLTDTVYTDSKNIEYRLYNEAYLATVTGIDNYSSTILEIPSMVNISYQVYKIEDDAVSGIDIERVVLSDKIIDIGDGNFVNLQNLENIDVSSANLHYYSVNGSVLVDKATNSVILGTTNGQVPEGVVEIDANAYSGLNITEIVLPSSVTLIGENAFANCTSLESVTFAEGASLTSIGKGAFTNCVKLKSINIPSTITKIEPNTFQGCASLESVNFDSQSILTEIGDYAFDGCENLTVFIFPSTLTTIGSYAFSGAGVENLVVPEGLTSLGMSAFKNSSLTSVDFSQNTNIRSLQAETFRSCTSLAKVTLSPVIYSIGDYCFSGCESLSELDFGQNSVLNTIGDYAFQVTSALISIEFPSNLQDIGDYAFLMSGLTELSFPEDSRLESIGEYAFNDTSLAGEVVFPQSLKTIGRNAFYSNDLISIAFQGDIESIETYAFAQNPNLRFVTFASSQVADMGYSALPNTDKIVINVPEQYIDTYKSQLYSLRERIFIGSFIEGNIIYAVTDGNNVTVIGSQNEAVETIAIGESISYNGQTYIATAIADHAFSGLQNLRTLTLPSTIVEIGEQILQNCPSVTTISVDPRNTTFESRGTQIILISTGESIDLGL